MVRDTYLFLRLTNRPTRSERFLRLNATVFQVLEVLVIERELAEMGVARRVRPPSPATWSRNSKIGAASRGEEPTLWGHFCQVGRCALGGRSWLFEPKREPALALGMTRVEASGSFMSGATIYRALRNERTFGRWCFQIGDDGQNAQEKIGEGEEQVAGIGAVLEDKNDDGGSVGKFFDHGRNHQWDESELDRWR